MSNDNTTGQQFGKQLPMVADLLSAPLIAAASANSFMVKEQTRFLMDTCFVAKGDNRYEPVVIEMSLSKSVMTESDNHQIKQQRIESVFQIPLLTLVPLNSLAVSNVDIDFSLEIVSYVNENSSNSNGDNTTQPSGNKNTGLTGKLSYDANDKSDNRSHNASKLNVKIHAGTVPLPLGVTTLIDLYVKSINAIPVQSE